MLVHEYKPDNLELDRLSIVVKNVPVTVGAVTTEDDETVITGAATAGTIKRGQVIDLDHGRYVPHETAGKSNVMAYSDVEYAAGDKEVVVPCYIAGKLRASEAVTETQLTAADEEALRVAGIILA